MITKIFIYKEIKIQLSKRMQSVQLFQNIKYNMNPVMKYQKQEFLILPNQLHAPRQIKIFN